MQELAFFGDMAVDLEDPLALLADDEIPSSGLGINKGEPWEPPEFKIEPNGRTFSALRLDVLGGCWLFTDVVSECIELLRNANKNVSQVAFSKKLNGTYQAGIGRLVKWASWAACARMARG